MKYITVLLIFFSLMFWISCSHFDELQANPKESERGGDESHNAGRNCGSCHNMNGNEAKQAGWWIISGTTFQSNGRPQKNAIVEIWEKPGRQGKLIKSLVTDDSGNFYTNQILNFKGGAYPSITLNDKTISMGSAFNGGSCNSCHGVSTPQLSID